MGKFLYFLVYLLLFVVGFGLLKFANVMDVDNGPKSELLAKFLAMITALIAVTRCGLNIYLRLFGRKFK